MLECIAQQLPWGRGVELALLDRETGYAASPLIMTKVEEASITPTVCALSTTEAQILMDSLWDCGLRPSAGSGSAGSLAATQRHLEDMRTLVFNKD